MSSAGKRDNMSGWRGRSERLPVYNLASNQDGDVAKGDGFHVEKSKIYGDIPLAAIRNEPRSTNLNINSLTDSYPHRLQYQHEQQRDGIVAEKNDKGNSEMYYQHNLDIVPHGDCEKGFHSPSEVPDSHTFDLNMSSSCDPQHDMQRPASPDLFSSSSHDKSGERNETSIKLRRFPSSTSSRTASLDHADSPKDDSMLDVQTRLVNTAHVQRHRDDHSWMSLAGPNSGHLDNQDLDIDQQMPLLMNSDPISQTLVNKYDRSPPLDFSPSKGRKEVDIADMTRADNFDNIESNVTDRKDDPHLIAYRTSHPSPSRALTKKTNIGLLQQGPAAFSDMSSANASSALQTSDSYIPSAYDPAPPFCVEEGANRKSSLADTNNHRTDTINQGRTMGDDFGLDRHGDRPIGLPESDVTSFEARANGVANDHRSPKKKKSYGAAVAAACNNKVSNGVLVDDDDENDEKDDDNGRCGWKKIQFDCCQKFRDAKWFLVVLTMCGACQGMAVNGFVNTVISTVERRFEISSTESGLIASCYDIMFVILVIPISYFGGQGHKPRYLGIGIFVLGIGSFVFALPHFVTDYYHVENADETVCKLNHNVSSSCSTDNPASLSNYKYVFYLGQLLHGAGATPLYTLGVTFMDENVPQRSSSFYNGIFYTGAIIGPAIGYMVGAKFLDIYTDVRVDPKSLGLDPSNPKWVGAWWIGFLISGTFAVLLSLPLLAFPTALPGSKKYALERGKETQASKHVDQTGQHQGIKDILLSLKYLLTNIPFMFINIAAAADGILVAGFSTFMPKFIEYEFGLPAGTSALYVGLAVVPAGGGATFAGGFIVKCFNLKMRGILRLCTVMSVILCVLAVALLMECQTTPFAGVTLPYGQTDVGAATFLGKNLDNVCNQNCSCAEEDFFPVCGRDKVLYFSPCYAGCTHVISDGSTKKYANCSCINYNLTASDYADGSTYLAEFGKCEFNCKWLTVFLLCFGFMIVFVFITSMPSLTATLRCVPDHQRSFGLGIQWIVARCLGSIPGPILFGKMFDFACLVWQKRCSGDGSCFFYDTHKLSLYLLALALAFAIAAALSFLLALCFYKVKEAEDEVILQVHKSSPESPQKLAAHHSRRSSDSQGKSFAQNDIAHNDADNIGTNL